MYSFSNVRNRCLSRVLDILKTERKCTWIFNNFYSTETTTDIPVENIRNFSIIAHVDHGKSTLADRFLELTGAIKANSGKQVLDKLQVEKERGITVKAQTASLFYTYKDQKYLLNLIDTPGHVDFSSEVYRSLAPCQGVVLLVDANDGVQAQTVANYYLAFERKLTIIPVLNKIDLKNAKPERVMDQMKILFNISKNLILKISAKNGTNVESVLHAIIEKIPPPPVNRAANFHAIIFDSWFEPYKGAISLIYVLGGSLRVTDQITSAYSQKSYEIKSLFRLQPEECNVNLLAAGQVGCIVCNMKSTSEAFIGDTLYLKGEPVKTLSKFEPPKPMVFAGLYPLDQNQFSKLDNAIQKLTLNDNAVTVVPDSSAALGRGWRLGFLGLLHMEVFSQRLEQEYDMEPIITAPSVTYKAKITGKKNIASYGGEIVTFENPMKCPSHEIVVEYYEPMIMGTIITPDEFVSPLMSLCFDRRGIEKHTQNIGNDRTILLFLLPLNEVIVDFHDSLKRITSGFASFDYEEEKYQPADLKQVDFALNGKIVEELSIMVHASKAVQMGREICTKLLDIVPQQQFLIAIQAMCRGKVLARETLKPYRKDVTGKLYGRDVTRRKKLLAKQAEGKKKLRMVGNVALPRDAFITLLKK